jgi:hypothetical protein
VAVLLGQGRTARTIDAAGALSAQRAAARRCVGSRRRSAVASIMRRARRRRRLPGASAHTLSAGSIINRWTGAADAGLKRAGRLEPGVRRDGVADSRLTSIPTSARRVGLLTPWSRTPADQLLDNVDRTRTPAEGCSGRRTPPSRDRDRPTRPMSLSRPTTSPNTTSASPHATPRASAGLYSVPPVRSRVVEAVDDDDRRTVADARLTVRVSPRSSSPRNPRAGGVRR